MNITKKIITHEEESPERENFKRLLNNIIENQKSMNNGMVFKEYKREEWTEAFDRLFTNVSEYDPNTLEVVYLKDFIHSLLEERTNEIVTLVKGYIEENAYVVQGKNMSVVLVQSLEEFNAKLRERYGI